MTKSEDRLAKYWEEQFDVGELKWNEAFEELDQTLLEKWNAKKESIIAESTDHKGKCFVKNFEKCVEDDLKKEILLPKVEEFTEARRENLSEEWGDVWSGAEIDTEVIEGEDNPYKILEELGKGPESKVTGAKYFKEGVSVILTKDSVYGAKGEMVTIADADKARALYDKNLARMPTRAEIF